MPYNAKTDLFDYDPQNPLNPDAIPKAVDMNRIEQGIADAHEATEHLSNTQRTTFQVFMSGWRF